MSKLLTNTIDPNSFMGLITNIEKRNIRLVLSKKTFTKIESREVLMSFALAAVVIIMGLTAGSVLQQKMEYAQYSAFMTKISV